MMDLVQEIAGVTGAIGANAPKYAVADGNSEFDSASVRMVRDMCSARVLERALRVAIAMLAPMDPPFNDDNIEG